MNGHALAVQGLNKQQRDFVIHYIETADPVRAAELAGFASPYTSSAHTLLRSAAVVAAVQAEVLRRIRTEGATVAQNVLISIAKDKTAPAGVRVDASKTLLDRAGIPAIRAADMQRPGERPLSDYTIDELQQMIPRLEAERSKSAKDVTPAAHGEPSLARETTQAIEEDMFS